MDVASLLSPSESDKVPIIRSRSTQSPSASQYKRLAEHCTASYFTAVAARRTYCSLSQLLPPANNQSMCSLPSITVLLDRAHAASMIFHSHISLRRPRITDAHFTEREGTCLSANRESDSWPRSPLRPGSGFSSNGHLPSASFVSAASSSPAAKINVTYHTEPIGLPSPINRSPVSSQGSVEYANGAPFSAPAVSSYFSPVESSPRSTPAYYQRNRAPNILENGGTFPPTSTVLPLSRAHQHKISPVDPAWQNSRYFPSAYTPYQQNHGRYTSRTCHRAFSRRSALRTHCHSHVGGNPFRCAHEGCGKSFRTRSNMKRHERGCHTGSPILTAVVG
jgi:hypothetical protein